MCIILFFVSEEENLLELEENPAEWVDISGDVSQRPVNVQLIKSAKFNRHGEFGVWKWVCCNALALTSGVERVSLLTSITYMICTPNITLNYLI